MRTLAPETSLAFLDTLLELQRKQRKLVRAAKRERAATIRAKLGEAERVLREAEVRIEAIVHDELEATARDAERAVAATARDAGRSGLPL